MGLTATPMSPATGGSSSSSTSSNSSSGGGSRLVLAVLGHPYFSTVMWTAFLLMSWIMVHGNLVSQTWGIGTFASITERIERDADKYVPNTPFFDAEGKPSVLAYAGSPAGRFMHMLPAGLWSVIAPLQLSPTFRAKHRTAHRRLGRLFVLMSIAIALGVVPILRSRVSVLRKSAIIDAGLLVLTAYFLVTGLLATVLARQRRYADHRVWVLRHVAMGYSAHVQRLVAALSWWALPHVVPGYTDLTPEGALLRGDMFGLYFVVGVVLSVGGMELWLRHTSPSGVVGSTPDQRNGATSKAS